MSSWKKISLSVLIFIILLLGTVAFLVGTKSGMHLLFNAITNYLVPELKISEVTGGWRDLYLKNIRYQQPGVVINAGELHLAVNFSCLCNSKLCINNLSLKDVNVAIDLKKMSPIMMPLKGVNIGSLNHFTPYQIVIYQVALENINLKIDDTTVSVMDFSSGLRWQEWNLILTPSYLRGLLITLPKVANMKKETIKTEIQDTQIQKKFSGEILRDFLSSKKILQKIIDIHLPLNLDIKEFKGEQLHLIGDTDLMIFSVLMKMSNIDGNMKLSVLDINTNQGSANATGNLLLCDNWPVNITFSSALNIDPLKGEKVELKVRGALRDKLKFSIKFSGPVNMVLSGQTMLDEATLQLNLEVMSKQLSWPLNSSKQFQANDIKLKLKGKMINYVMADYTLSFRTSVKGRDVPPAIITLNAKGNKQQINLDKLTVAALEGKTELTASIDWQKAISWRGDLKLTGINTAKEVPNWPSKLDGLIKTHGSLCGGNWQIDVSKIKLVGIVKQNKVKVDGSLKGNNYLQWVIPGLHIMLGRNTADIRGELGVKYLNLNAAINAPNLDNALLGLVEGGSARGFIKVRGTVEAPQLLADITANSLRWQDISIARVQMNGEVKSTDQIGGKLDLSVERITQPGINISSVILAAKGSEKQHDIKLRVQGDPASGQLHITGSFDRQAKYWKGQLDNTRFNTSIGPLTLSRAITLNYHNSKQKISIGPHCWSTQHSELCIPQTINAGVEEGHAMVNLNRFDLATIKPFMPNTMQISGILNGKADMTWSTKEELPKGRITFSGHNVKITQIVNKVPLAISFGALNLKTELHNNCVQLGWLMRIANNGGQFEGQMQVNDPQGKRNLRGIINIRKLNLAIANVIFQHDEKITGLLNANLRMAGNVQSPQLFGQMQLNGVSIDGNFMPFDMQQSQLMMNFNGTSSILTGEVRTSYGQINLSGDADWSQIDNWRARVAVKGSCVRIALSPIMRLDVSPDIVFKATPSLLTLDGKVDVPWARIMIRDVSESMVGISNDEVLLNENLKPITQKSASISINSNLIMHIGNNVRLDAFGLKTRLTGDLKVVQDKQGLRMNGQINIPEGHFHAYGQDLIIRKSKLLFSGPLDQPVLNIEAIRNLDATEDHVIAGVHITGFANEPRVEIFSDPEMSQQEALSYLLRGKRLNSNQNDSAAMTTMLIELGVTKSGQVMGKIGETFGVSNLALSTQGIGDSSQVVISGYILPNLQVKYSIGIFDQLAMLTLRYRIMPKLYLEVISGVDQALDLLYQFDFQQ